jgi:DMSO/TMAO reductase YedYZ molybdopterin-dependent catalytic subunit
MPCSPLEAASSTRPDDLLEENVLLADRLDGGQLSLEHGAPFRLVAPDLYAYKSVKHLFRIRLRKEFRRGLADRQTLAHPRGRVALLVTLPTVMFGGATLLINSMVNPSSTEPNAMMALVYPGVAALALAVLVLGIAAGESSDDRCCAVDRDAAQGCAPAQRQRERGSDCPSEQERRSKGAEQEHGAIIRWTV